MCLDDPNAPKVRGMSTGKGVADTVGKTKTKLKLTWCERINGPEDGKAASAAAHSIGATIRNHVNIIAPNFSSLPKWEMYRVVVALKVLLFFFFNYIFLQFINKYI